MAWSVKQLLCKLADLSLDPQYPWNLDTVRQTQADARSPAILVQWNQGAPGPTGKLCLKKQNGGGGV